VCTQRTIIASADATEELESFARWCALQVAHLWDCSNLVRKYLKTGDQELRADARDAAYAASRDDAAYAARAVYAAASYAASRDARAVYVAASYAAYARDAAHDASAAAAYAAYAVYVSCVARRASYTDADVYAASDVYASAARDARVAQNQELELRLKKLLSISST